MSAVARALYGGLLRLLLPAYLLRLWWRGRAEPLYRHALGERLGCYASDAPPGMLWIHAVSLGETRAAAALIESLRAERPELRLLLTHGTATGRAAGTALLGPGDHQCWLPWDTPGAVRRFLAHWQPMAGVLMETEIWPVLLHEAQAAGVPMLLANARLSERSLRRGRRAAALLRPAVASLAQAFAQTEADAERLREAGVPGVTVTGNLKFDMTPDPALLARGRAWATASARPIVLAASTREGEEEALLSAWVGTGLGSRARLWLVPRHPQRFEAVARAVARAGLSLACRSDWGEDRPDETAEEAEVWLGDSLGEMPAYYAAAQVALLGGSFAPLGGQNLIEAAACGCPLLMGPHTFNFAQAAEQALAAGAAERVVDWSAALARVGSLLDEPSTRMAMAHAATGYARTHQGAAQRMARAVCEQIACREGAGPRDARA